VTATITILKCSTRAETFLATGRVLYADHSDSGRGQARKARYEGGNLEC
jgi:hypothetical protein